MAYNMSQINCNFFIEADKKLGAFNHAREYLLANIKKQLANRYRLVDTSSILNAQTIEDLLLAFLYRPEIADNGDIIAIHFEGETLGDEEQLFDAIAPFVKENSWIEMEWKEGEICRWVFKNYACGHVML